MTHEPSEEDDLSPMDEALLSIQRIESELIELRQSVASSVEFARATQLSAKRMEMLLLVVVVQLFVAGFAAYIWLS